MNSAQKESQDKIIRESNDMAAAERAKAAEPSENAERGRLLFEQVKAEQNTENYRLEERGWNIQAAENRAAYVKSQRDYFESVSEGMSAQSIIDRGGVQLADTQTISGGAAAIVAAGGERKGTLQTIESGAAGIVAAGGQRKGPYLEIGATFREQYQAVRWGAGMQAYRTLVRQYQKAQREKKKNDGGLTAARQPYGSMNFIQNRPTFKVGAITFNPMSFDGFIPLVKTWAACETGWVPNDGTSSDVLARLTNQTARRHRSLYSSGWSAPASTSANF